MKTTTAIVLLIAICTSISFADDLYKVRVSSESEAQALNTIGARPVYRLNDGYLVLLPSDISGRLTELDLDAEFLSGNVDSDRLAVDNRMDLQNVGKYSVVYEEDALRIFSLPFPRTTIAASDLRNDIIPIDYGDMKIEYRFPVQIDAEALLAAIDLETLVANVSQDSVEAYMYQLQSYDGRLTGTTSCRASADWIKAKFESFGYTDVEFQYFTGYQGGDPVSSRNVVARKTGSRYPNRQVVVGAHYDAVNGSPGADDNGSGTTGVLEIARVLASVDNDLTLIFIAFDSEESGLVGSEDYSQDAYYRGDDIVMMFNMDMIGHYENNNYADLHYGPEQAYVKLWDQLANSLVGIDGFMAGPSGNSDHAPFVQWGYDVAYASEYYFSTVYHTYQDSTTYVNFDYMTRMIKASLATVYSVGMSLSPVTTLSAYDVGDGQSVQVNWLYDDPSATDHYELYYVPTAGYPVSYIEVEGNQTSFTVTSLTENQAYNFYLIRVDSEGHKSIKYNAITCTPRVTPLPPQDIVAAPVYHGVTLSWSDNNTELDFDHYTVIRDGEALPDIVYATTFNDLDPTLGPDFHDYHVVAVDNDGYQSDTTGIVPVSMRAATLDEGKILAINRTGRSLTLADSSITEDFLQEGLLGLDYDYIYDPSTSGDSGIVKLVDMIGYELVVIGAESGKGYDDLASMWGIMNFVQDYQSFGGKLLVFGRWGDITTLPSGWDTMYYAGQPLGSEYIGCFDTYSRFLPLTGLDFTNLTMKGDLVGAHSQQAEYPDLAWDSVATANHSYKGITFGVSGGIPCPSIPNVSGSGLESIYTYDSATDSSLTEGRIIGWRSLVSSRKYVFFDIPLSFMEREPAVMALRQAVSDLGIDVMTDWDSDGVLDTEDNCPFVHNPLQEDSDSDGIGDACEECCGLYNDGYTGNTNFDTNGDVTLSDITQLVDRIYISKQPLPCPENGNTNGSVDGKITLADITRLIDHLYISKGPTAPCP